MTIPKLSMATGLGSVGFVTGYMVAGSSTPVAGAMAPLVFGLVVSGVAFFNRGKTSEMPEFLTSFSYGVVLFIIAAAFLGGAFVGANHRINGLPWESEKPIWLSHKEPAPPSFKAALDWLNHENTLRARGYEDDAILAMYKLKQKDWGFISTSKLGAELGGFSLKGSDEPALTIPPENRSPFVSTHPESVDEKEAPTMTPLVEKKNPPKIFYPTPLP